MLYHMLKFHISWTCTFFAINDTSFHFCEVIPRAKTPKMIHEWVKNPLESHKSPYQTFRKTACVDFMGDFIKILLNLTI